MNAISYLTNNVLPPKHEESTITPHRLKDSEKTNERAAGVPKEARKSKRARWTLLWSILAFLPNLIVIKPVLFMWFVITFPLSLIERSSSSESQGMGFENAEGDSKLEVSSEAISPKNASRINTITEEEDDLAGEEMILQADTVKGSLTVTSDAKERSQDRSRRQQQQPKTSRQSLKTGSVRSGVSSSAGTALGSRRMGRFLFPKKLIPQSVLNRRKRRTLVLDLDETLIHSMSRGTSSSNSSQGHMVEVKFATSGISTLYHVHKRPYCDLFLTKIAKWYDLVVFTASMKEYADPVIDWLESSFPGKFSRRLYRQDCILRDGVGYIKDLSVVMPNASLSDIFIIDNSPVSYAMHVDNAIQVEGWISDPTDTDLLNLLPLLEALRFTTDIRNVLALKSGEHAFTHV
ncbi:LAQU0S01e09978g1_1 [Lachancea quebecensis]|uniref:LAQU0S01e09978g1_1 n=1 Tax=Lachancea quebecensis TaxID=1654605 RepID=A0A0P1KMH6_9SACH|nr:LAQU0S01e09978g1_1 [Lachancea quebecensis]